MSEFLNTKIYTTNETTISRYKSLCGVKTLQREVNPIGVGFTERGQKHGFIVTFEKGSGIDDGEFGGITYREVTKAEVDAAYKELKQGQKK